MRRFIVSLVVVAGVLLSACTEEQETFQPAGLSGTYDLALVGDLLFVTSAGSDELRVLALSPDDAQRRFVRAPNPLEPLSIPVLDRPQALTRDVRYDSEGLEKPGSYVYARSSGSTQISVVDAALERLKELARLDTKVLTQGQSSGPVTAFAARADEAGGSTLYFATQELNGGRLWQVQLPDPAQLTQLTQDAEDTEVPVPGLTAVPVEGATLPDNVAVSSILVMPQAGVLAVSTRSPAGSATSGMSYWVDLGTRERRELKFGAQVLQLATHEKVGDVLTAGQRIFGVLDASSCGGETQCTGVLAVEAGTGEVAMDATGYPMMTLNAGAGLPMGLSLSTNTRLVVQPEEPYTASSQREPFVPLLGIVPLSNGDVFFFDAVNLVPFNVNANNVTETVTDPTTGEAVTTTQARYEATANISLVNAQGVALEGEGPSDIQFAGTYGVTRDQTYLLTYEGVLPEMNAVQREEDTGAFKVPRRPRGEDKGPVVQPGDILILQSSGTGGQVCGTELRVAAVQEPPPGSDDDRSTLVPSGAIPEECAGYGYFQVRASGSQPLVLSSLGEDYIQRLGVGEAFSRQGSHFIHPPGYQGRSEDTEVSIRVVGLSRSLERGFRYVVTTVSHYFPYIITVDTTNITDFRYFRLPGPVVYWKAADGSGFAYIVYPSASGLLQVDLNDIDAAVANSRGLVSYR